MSASFLKLGYLGPPGSFTHSAVDLLATPWPGEVVDYSSIEDVIFAVEFGEVDAGLVPLETSVEGDISSTVDELIFRSSLCFINEEIVVPVSYVVAGQADADLARVQTLISTPSAVAQCRRFVAATQAELQLVGSPAEASRLAAETDDPRIAALTNAKSVRIHQLAILRGVADDHSGVSAKMAVLRHTVPAPTGHDYSSVVVTPSGDRTGTLVDILRCFADRDIALSAISSRPWRTRQGQYSFLLTAHGHVADSRVQEALRAATDLPAEVKLLGSYPVNPELASQRVTDASPPGSVSAEELSEWLVNVLAQE